MKFGLRYANAGVRRLEDLGVGRFMVPPPAFDPDGVTQGLERLGDLIAKV